MNQFFVKLGDSETYKKLLKEPLTYVAGAVLLSIIQISHLAATGNIFGITGCFANWGAWVYTSLGGDVSSWAAFSTDAAKKSFSMGFLKDPVSLRNLGIVFGALFSTLLASQFKIKKLKSVKQLVAAVIGGLLMGYGARLAGGCNIGALYSAIASLSLSGWVFGVFLFVGAFIGGKLLKKFFM